MKTVIDAVNEFKGILMHNTKFIYDKKAHSNKFYSASVELKDSTLICTSDEFNECVEEMANMNVKPVYTQAMADAGVMPSVGMECLINFPDIDNAWYEYTIDFMGKHVFIASCKDVSERFGHIEDVHIKPLTPPIELIDGKAYQFDYKFDKYTGIYSDIDNNHKADIFIIIDGHVMSSYCTNIQLLEVKS